MNIKFKFSLGLIFILFGIFACERDDICPEATVTTPKLVIEFYDINNTSNPKNVNDLAVRAIDNDSLALGFNSTSTIALPLKTNAIETTYIFNLNAQSETGGLVDTLNFSYATVETYLNRACGFKVDFIDFDARLISDLERENTWIRDIQVEETIIDNEFETHLNIFY
jgi:hypothetical protein